MKPPSDDPNKNWKRDDIQFPRLIAELEAVGAFTPRVMKSLRESMDLENEDIGDIVSRAQVVWEWMIDQLQVTRARNKKRSK